MLNTISEYIIEVVTNPLLVAIFTIFLTAYVGFRGFKKQRIRDEFVKEYIDEGLSKLCIFIINNLNILERNHGNCVFIIKEFRDNTDEHFLKNCENKLLGKLLDVDPSLPPEFYKSINLINTNSFQSVLSHTRTDFKAKNDKYITEIPNALRKYITKQESMHLNRNDFCLKLIEMCDAQLRGLEYIYKFINLLGNISFRLRTMQLDKYSDISKINKDKVINKYLCAITILEEHTNSKQSLNKVGSSIADVQI